MLDTCANAMPEFYMGKLGSPAAEFAQPDRVDAAFMDMAGQHARVCADTVRLLRDERDAARQGPAAAAAAAAAHARARTALGAARKVLVAASKQLRDRFARAEGWCKCRMDVRGIQDPCSTLLAACNGEPSAFTAHAARVAAVCAQLRDTVRDRARGAGEADADADVEVPARVRRLLGIVATAARWTEKERSLPGGAGAREDEWPESAYGPRSGWTHKVASDATNDATNHKRLCESVEEIEMHVTVAQAENEALGETLGAVERRCAPLPPGAGGDVAALLAPVVVLRAAVKVATAKVARLLEMESNARKGNPVCLICSEPPTDAFAYPCGHLFCEPCARTWATKGPPGGWTPKVRPSCSACRAPWALSDGIRGAAALTMMGGGGGEVGGPPDAAAVQLVGIERCGSKVRAQRSVCACACVAYGVCS